MDTTALRSRRRVHAGGHGRNSWDGDAIVRDKKTGLFAHPDKIAASTTREVFPVARSFTVPRSSRHPVIIRRAELTW
jgi:hypothetical protein